MASPTLALGPETPEEATTKLDFRTHIWSVFQELYEDKWDPGESPRAVFYLLSCWLTICCAARWNAAVGEWIVDLPALEDGVETLPTTPPWLPTMS